MIIQNKSTISIDFVGKAEFELFCQYLRKLGVNTLSKLKLKSKLRKQTDFRSSFRINTLSKLEFFVNWYNKQTSERPIQQKLISADTDNRPMWPILSADNIGRYRPFLSQNWAQKLTFNFIWYSKIQINWIECHFVRL